MYMYTGVARRSRWWFGSLGTVHMCCYVNTTRSHNTTRVVEDPSKSISTPCSQENEGIQHKF